MKKTETNPLVLKQKLAEFKNLKQTGNDIYTDDSKDFKNSYRSLKAYSYLLKGE